MIRRETLVTVVQSTDAAFKLPEYRLTPAQVWTPAIVCQRFPAVRLIRNDAIEPCAVSNIHSPALSYTSLPGMGDNFKLRPLYKHSLQLRQILNHAFPPIPIPAGNLPEPPTDVLLCILQRLRPSRLSS